ncbi:MAG: hypothetical protein QXW39_04425 [Candidatus Bathyarchaeia archaeon]|nr:hypothetical protein [Candidatus Bathyarchaeota archaeon]
MARISKEALEIIIGGILLVIGFILSFLMAIDILEKSIPLSIFAFSISFAGLLIGFYGIYGLVVVRQARK